jgi:hypothetical protein
MKTKLLVILAVAFCFVGAPLSLLADSYPYTPPPKKGVIFIVIENTYSSRNITHSMNVTVKWGTYNNSQRFYFTGTRTSGVVIRLRHDNKDSVPMLVQTSSGRIKSVEQTARSPAEWTSDKYIQKDW